MSDTTIIRPFRPGDENAIRAVLHGGPGDELGPEEWGWCYPQNPPPRRIVVAWRGDRVIAHAAANAVPARIDGRPCTMLRCRDSLCTGDTAGLWTRTGDCFAAAFLDQDGPVMLIERVTSPRFSLVRAVAGDAVTRLSPIRMTRTATSPPRSLRRRAYRVELARDWEPALDTLWRRVAHLYPTGAVRDADHALTRLSGHPTLHHHRLLVFARFSATPVAFAAFTVDPSGCRWVDLVWDHGHPGAVELLSRASARLAAGAGTPREEIWVHGDDACQDLLANCGFVADDESSIVFALGVLSADHAADEVAAGLHLTMADAPVSTARAAGAAS
jgi:hypothetical protein